MNRLRKYVLFLLLLVALPIVAQTGGALAVGDSVAKARRFDYFYMQALEHKEAEDYDAAYSLFEYCLALRPGSPIVLSELASFYRFLGRKEEAARMLRQAIEGEPDNFWYRQSLALFYQETGEPDKALEVYEHMLQRFGSNSELYIELAGLYDEMGQYDKVIEVLDKLEAREGKSEMLSLQKYRIYMRLQDKENSLRELRELADEYPDDLRFRVSIGDTYLRFGDKDEALNTYLDVLSQEHNNVAAQYSLANFYALQGNDSLYTEAMERLLMNDKFSEREARTAMMVDFVRRKEHSDSTGYAFRLFDRLMQLPFGLTETAEVYANYMLAKEVEEERVRPVLQLLLQLEPENSTAQMQMLRYAIEHRDYSEVISRCDTALLYHPELMGLYYYRGLACSILERFDEALETFEKGIERRSDDTAPELVSDVFAMIGDTKYRLGDRDGCYAAYDSALVYDENITVLNNYAYYLSLERRDLERALEMSAVTLKAQPDDATYIDTYAWILFCLGRYEEAKAYMEKLFSLVPDEEVSSVEFHHAGDIYAKCGDTDNALRCWTRAQTLGDDSKILKRKIKKRKYIPDGKRK